MSVNKIIVISTVLLSIMIVFFVPLIEPVQSIQCVAETQSITDPCYVPNITIYDWIISR